MSDTVTQTSPSAPTRHSKYYMEDEMSIFQVEQKLFKVHRHFLRRDSDVLGGMFALPPGESQTVEGRSDSSPIHLPGVTVEEFEALLNYFYETTYDAGPSEEHFDNLAVARWTLLLSISTKLQFSNLHTTAILALTRERMDDVDRISIARQYDIEEWIEPSLQSLCRRQHFLSDAEVRKVGYDLAFRLARAREMILSKILLHFGLSHWSTRLETYVSPGFLKEAVDSTKPPARIQVV